MDKASFTEGERLFAPLESRARVRALPSSKIREIANEGFGKSDLLRFWFGESDQPTPDYIKKAAIEAINANQTFYTHNSGRAELRASLASYLSDLHARPFAPENISITSSGVSALNIAMQTILEPGDRVVIVTPIWPNVAEIPRILNAQVVRVGLTAHGGHWHLDVQQLLDAITPQTRMVVINSPSNPTGWTIPAQDRIVILDRCRRFGVWLLLDDVYERLVFDPELASAPSFLAIADREDRIIAANSFSKTWLMTGWRLGWLVAPAQLEADLGKIIEFNTSCAPDFVQLAGLAAIEQGEAHVSALRQGLKDKRDLLARRLGALKGVTAPAPDGGMYLFFKIEGHDDSVALSKRLISEARLGLAPGAAFGPEGEGWLRWCFAADTAALNQGVEHLQLWLGQ